MRPKNNMFEGLEELEEDPKEEDNNDDKDNNKEDDKDELNKDGDENDDALFPTSW